ncbi:hypothetical protein MmiAt1_15510 [Methanimicrococcus sp. At1]|uniref:Uncharacterized protein n=1 Tax=Methanimicrococcus hacksteinii TaxID=3028293 RepID=A0ABU3VRB5_9EURY|nr:hypothetical protein [Methanimicrococcus sp. At1]MDV0445947.1 hypothetical protein [Methanimicrococcus sp. At1]
MIESSKGMKIAVIAFFAVLIVVAVLGVGDSWEHQRGTGLPVNGSIGMMVICYDFPEFEELADFDLIVVGTVSDKYGAWGTEDGKKPLSKYKLKDAGIYTYYELENIDVLKGNVSELTVRTPGGEADGYALHVGSFPWIETGDNVLLFLRTNYDADNNVLDWYYIGEPNVFTEIDDGVFENGHYGSISIEELKDEIAKAQERKTEQ